MQSEPIDNEQARRLRRWNITVGLIHAVQATILLVIATDVSLPVYASWIDGPPGAADLIQGDPLFELPFAPAVAAFLYLAAADHLLVSFGRPRRWYERNLDRSVNYARWIEYSLSASLMVALIAMLAGVWELNALIAIFAVNTAMILFGLLMERRSRPGPDADWLPFWIGTGIGIVPWIAIAIQLARGQSRDRKRPRLRLRDLLQPACALRPVRGQYVAAVPAGRALARLPVRRTQLHRPQPYREVGSRLAGLRRGIGRLLGPSAAGGRGSDVNRGGGSSRSMSRLR